MSTTTISNVSSVEFREDREWIGVEISLKNPQENEEKKIRVLISQGGECCEYWNVQVVKKDGFDPSKFDGREDDFDVFGDFKEHLLTYGCKSIDEIDDIFGKQRHDGCFYVYEVESCTGAKYYIIAYNLHEGYYPHALWTSWPVPDEDDREQQEVMGISYYRRLQSEETDI